MGCVGTGGGCRLHLLCHAGHPALFLWAGLARLHGLQSAAGLVAWPSARAHPHGHLSTVPARLQGPQRASIYAEGITISSFVCKSNVIGCRCSFWAALMKSTSS